MELSRATWAVAATSRMQSIGFAHSFVSRQILLPGHSLSLIFTATHPLRTSFNDARVGVLLYRVGLFHPIHPLAAPLS